MILSTAPSPSPFPPPEIPPQIPDWFIRAALDPAALRHTLVQAAMWMLVAFVVARMVKMVFTDLWPYELPPARSRKIGKVVGGVVVVALLGALGYLSWILAVLLRNL